MMNTRPEEIDRTLWQGTSRNTGDVCYEALAAVTGRSFNPKPSALNAKL